MSYFISLLIVLALLVPGIPSVSNAATEITFWTTEVSPDRQAVIQYLVKAFAIFNPDIEIQVVGIEENSIANALAHGQNSGDGPDVIGCASDLIISFDNRGWVNPDSTGRIISSIGKDRFYQGALNKLQKTESRYSGIPFNGWIQGIWYRKDWFAEHGLAPPDNWHAILEAAKTLHDPQNGRYGILLGTNGDTYTEQIFTHLALSNGVKAFSATGEVVFDSPETIETINYYKNLSKYTPPGPQRWRGRDFYLQGKLGMMFYSTFIMDDLALPSVAADSLTGKNFPELNGAPYDHRILTETGMISSITGTQKASYGVINALAVLQNYDEEKTKAAEAFVNFLFTDAAYITWLHMVPGGMLPVLRDVSDRPEFFRDTQGVFHRFSRQRVQAIMKGFDSLKSFSFVDGVLQPRAAEASAMGLIPEMVQEVLTDKATPEQAVTKAADEMRDIDDVE